jgi:hypothetical protein
MVCWTCVPQGREVSQSCGREVVCRTCSRVVCLSCSRVVCRSCSRVVCLSCSRVVCRACSRVVCLPCSRVVTCDAVKRAYEEAERACEGDGEMSGERACVTVEGAGERTCDAGERACDGDERASQRACDAVEGAGERACDAGERVEEESLCRKEESGCHPMEKWKKPEAASLWLGGLLSPRIVCRFSCTYKQLPSCMPRGRKVCQVWHSILCLRFGGLLSHRIKGFGVPGQVRFSCFSC